MSQTYNYVVSTIVWFLLVGKNILKKENIKDPRKSQKQTRLFLRPPRKNVKKSPIKSTKTIKSALEAKNKKGQVKDQSGVQKQTKTLILEQFQIQNHQSCIKQTRTRRKKQTIEIAYTNPLCR